MPNTMMTAGGLDLDLDLAANLERGGKDQKVALVNLEKVAAESRGKAMEGEFNYERLSVFQKNPQAFSYQNQ